MVLTPLTSEYLREMELSAQWRLSAPFSHRHDFIYLGNIHEENSPFGQEGCESGYGFHFS